MKKSADFMLNRLFPCFLLLVFSCWLAVMQYHQWWPLFKELWPMSLTMAFGSFVAGSTPTGGAAVAFPVFTKILLVSTEQARTFGLMIQSIGMTSAALYILHRKTPILWSVVLWASLGSIIGLSTAIAWIQLPSPYPRLLFTLMLSLLGVALLYCHRHNALFELLPHPTTAAPFVLKTRRKLEFICLGFIGGVLSENTGSGVDIMVFMSLALAYRLPERLSIPTSIVCMAISSVVGFALHATVVKDTAEVMPYWLVCIPIVAVGAPLGAWAMAKCNKHQILRFLIVLISLDLISTAVLINVYDYLHAGVLLFVLFCTTLITSLILRGNRRLKRRRDKA